MTSSQLLAVAAATLRRENRLRHASRDDLARSSVALVASLVPRFTLERQSCPFWYSLHISEYRMPACIPDS